MPLGVFVLAVALTAQTSALTSTETLGQIYFLFLQGRDLADRNDVNGAIASYKKALDLDPDASDIRAELAELYARTNQILQAQVEARRAIEHDPDNRDANRVLGLIESAMIQQNPPGSATQRREAIGHLEHALTGGVSDLAVQLTIAELYLQNDDTAKAAAAARRFLEERPGYPRAVMVLVAALDANGRSDDARRAIGEMQGEDAEDLLALAGSFFDGGAFRHVVELLGPRVAAAEADDVASGAFGQMAAALGMAFLRLGEPKRAIEVIENASRRDAANGRLLFGLAEAYERDGQHDAAERTFRKIIAAEPKHAAALNYLGYMLADRGEKLDEAVGFITRALAIEGDNPSYLDSLGWAYFRLRRFGEALSPLVRAAALLPEISVIQDHLGDLYFEMKRYGEAAAAFGKALDGNRADVEVADITKKRDRARELATQK